MTPTMATAAATTAIPIMAPTERLLDAGPEVVNTVGEFVTVDSSNFFFNVPVKKNEKTNFP